MACDTHVAHTHVHGPDCGHASVQHGDHVDYFHDGHIHHEHDGHWDECEASHQTHADHGGHEHGPGCSHEAVSHGDHTDYLHDGHRHPVTPVTGTSTDERATRGQAPIT